MSARPAASRVAVAALVAVVLVSPAAALRQPAPAAPGAPALTAADRVRAVYDLILDASFDRAAASIAQCAPMPPEVCQVLDATRLWWTIQIDPASTALDARFGASVDRAIAATEAWARREPSRAEAWFYTGGAYGARVQWRVLRVERLAAARDGKRIKETLERAVALDPSLEDAYFGIGLYKYYADVAPAAAKFLRWLLLLPGGDKTDGLRQMLRTRERGTLMRGEADYQLHIIYLWYERDFRKALELLRGLERRYPRNPHFAQVVAEVLDTYVHDLTASRDQYARLLELARTGAMNVPGLAEAQARLGLARQLDALFESDRAVTTLDPVVALAPPAPYAAVARAQLLRAQALDRLGRRAESRAAYAAATAALPANDASGLRSRIRAAAATEPTATAAEAYRMSLQGWRAHERGDRADATRLLARAVQLSPDDAVIRYRYGMVLAGGGDAARALDEFERAIARGPAVAPTFFADAALEAARILETRGDRARALLLADRAAHTFGASAATRGDAQRAATRLRATR